MNVSELSYNTTTRVFGAMPYTIQLSSYFFDNDLVLVLLISVTALILLFLSHIRPTLERNIVFIKTGAFISFCYVLIVVDFIFSLIREIYDEDPHWIILYPFVIIFGVFGLIFIVICGLLLRFVIYGVLHHMKQH